MNILVEREAFIDSIRNKGAELINKFLPKGFADLYVCTVKGKTSICYIMGGVDQRVEMTRKWFRCILVSPASPKRSK